MRFLLLLVIFLFSQIVNEVVANECNQVLHDLLNVDTKTSANEIKKERFNLKAQGEDLKLPLMNTGNKVTYTYHWTKNKNYLNEEVAKSGLRKELGELSSDSTPLIDSGNAAGKGLYVAANALLTSNGYGDVLIEVPLKAGSDFGAEKSDVIINSHLSGLVYDFLHGKKNAAVIRSENAVDLEGIKIFDASPKLGTTLNEYAAYKGMSWKEAMLHYSGLYMASGRSYNRTVIRGFDDKAEIFIAGKKLFNEKEEVTDLGAAMILLGEVKNLKPSPKVLEDLTKTASTDNTFNRVRPLYNV